MNSFELNKIFGAILGTLVFVMGVGFIADVIYAPIENRGAAYSLPEPEDEGGAVAEAPSVEPIALRMQTASVEAGAGLIVRCQSCHDYSPTNTNRVGPGIYDVVGNTIANNEGFNYSNALQELAASGEIWDYDNLDHFLESPRTFAPGTTMSFAGLSNPNDRANLIAFLRSLTDGEPAPLPEPPAPEEPVDEAPAEEVPAEGAPVVEDAAPADAEVVSEEPAPVPTAAEPAAEDDPDADAVTEETAPAEDAAPAP